MASMRFMVFSAASASSGRKTRPTPYAPAGGRGEVDHGPEEARRGPARRMPAPSPVLTSPPEAPRWSRLQSASRASVTIEAGPALDVADERDPAGVVLVGWVEE